MAAKIVMVHPKCDTLLHFFLDFPLFLQYRKESIKHNDKNEFMSNDCCYRKDGMVITMGSNKKKISRILGAPMLFSPKLIQLLSRYVKMGEINL